MELLSTLLELQSVHDNLRTIERDLSALPPDLARLDQELKAVSKRLAEAEKIRAEAEAQQATLSKDLALAQRLEDHARAAVKSTANKIQYTHAIRELDERERAKGAIARPLKETESRLGGLATEIADLSGRRDTLQTQFQELHDIFLSEHQNQVVARETLNRRKAELEQALGPIETARFNRILQARNGRVVVAVDHGNCGGCRTKIRLPVLHELSQKHFVICEACQRVLFAPAQP